MNTLYQMSKTTVNAALNVGRWVLAGYSAGDAKAQSLFGNGAAAPLNPPPVLAGRVQSGTAGFVEKAKNFAIKTALLTARVAFGLLNVCARALAVFIAATILAGLAAGISQMAGIAVKFILLLAAIAWLSGGVAQARLGSAGAQAA